MMASPEVAEEAGPTLERLGTQLAGLRVERGAAADVALCYGGAEGGAPAGAWALELQLDGGGGLEQGEDLPLGPDERLGDEGGRLPSPAPAKEAPADQCQSLGESALWCLLEWLGGAPSACCRGALGVAMVALEEWASEEDAALLAVRVARKTLNWSARMAGDERQEAIGEVVDAGIVPRLVRFLRADSLRLQLEAARMLRDVGEGSDEQASVVVDNAAIPELVRMIQSPDEDCRKFAVWALGSVAGDSHRSGDWVLSAGALPPLLALLEDEGVSPNVARTAAWTLRMFTSGKSVTFEPFRRILQPIQRVISSSDDLFMLSHAVYALRHLSDRAEKTEALAFVECGLCPRLVELIETHQNSHVTRPAVRVLRNLVKRGGGAAAAAIDAGLLEALPRLLAGPDDSSGSVSRNACSIIGFACKAGKFQAVIDAGCVRPLLVIVVSLLRPEMRGIMADRGVAQKAARVVRTAAWALHCAVRTATPVQLQLLAMLPGGIQAFAALLTCAEADTLKHALDSLEAIFSLAAAGAAGALPAADDEMGLGALGLFGQIFVVLGGLQQLTKLFQRNDAIKAMAMRLFERFFAEFGGGPFDDLIVGVGGVGPFAAVAVDDDQPDGEGAPEEQPAAEAFAAFAAAAADDDQPDGEGAPEEQPAAEDATDVIVE